MAHSAPQEPVARSTKSKFTYQNFASVPKKLHIEDLLDFF